MFKIKKLVSIILVFMFLFILSCYNIPFTSYASTTDKKVAVTRSNENPDITRTTIGLEWDAVDNAKTYTVSYRKFDGTLVEKTDIEGTSTVITGLNPGYVYEFEISAKDEDGNPIDTIEADKYKVEVITAIKEFGANVIDEIIEPNTTEVGANSGIKIKWNKPKYYNGTSYIKLDESKVNYHINVRKSKSSTADAVEQFKLECSGSSYTLKRWKNGGNFIEVDANKYNLTQNDNMISFEWTKKADDDTRDSAPDKWEGKESALRPGTIYYIEIYPEFKDDIEYVKTELEKDFISTYLHMKLLRQGDFDSLVIVDRVKNDGTFVSIPNFRYEFLCGPDKNNLELGYYTYESYGGDNPPPTIQAHLVNTARFDIYYKVTATTDEQLNGKNIKLTSQLLQVNLGALTPSLPPIPENLEVVNVDVVETEDEDTHEKILKPIVKLRWDKPYDFEKMKDFSSGDNYFEYNFMLNTAIDDIKIEEGIDQYIKEWLYDENGDPIGNFDVKYRKAINVKLDELDVSKLKIISADEIDKGELNTGKDRIEYELGGNQILFPDSEEGYPDKLLLNKIYYLKMFTSKHEGDSEVNSDNTLALTFTIPPKNKNMPPLPLYINVDKITDKSIKVAWEAVTVKGNEYFDSEKPPIVNYEVSLSTDKEREIIDGSQEDGGAGKYGAFTKPIFTISSDEISEENKHLVTFFPSTAGKAREVTINGDELENIKKTLDPNTTYYILIRTKLVLEEEPDKVKYSSYSKTIAVTTLKKEIIGPGEDEKRPAAPDDFSIVKDTDGNDIIKSHSTTFKWSEKNDPDKTKTKYRMLRTVKSLDTAVNWNGIDIDELKKLYPKHLAADTMVAVDKHFDPITEEYTYHVDDLDANTLYFFSLRAEKEVSVTDKQTGESKTITLYSEWITIPVTTQILEQPTGLSVVNVDEEDDDYDIFDKCHDFKITWKGLSNHDFDIAYRAEDESTYTVVNTNELNDVTYSQTGSLQGSNYGWYTAIVTRLKSNTKYYIKIRTVDLTSKSKYTNAVTTRTEFSSSDHEQEEEDIQNDETFSDKLKEYNDRIYWIYDKKASYSSYYYKIKIRGSKAINYISNSAKDTFEIDLDLDNEANDKKCICSVYIPLKVIDALNKYDKTMVITTMNGDLVFRPYVLDMLNNDAIRNMINKKKEYSTVKDVYIDITFKNLKDSNTYKPSEYDLELVSNITALNSQVHAVTMSDEEFEKKIDNEVYGKDGTGNKDGIIYNKRRKLRGSHLDYYKLQDKMDDLLEEIEEETAKYIKSNIERSSYVKYLERIEDLYNPLEVNLLYDVDEDKNDNNINGYVITGKDKKWDRVQTYIQNKEMFLSFEINGLDNYKLAVMRTSTELDDIYGNQYDYEIKQIINKYKLDKALGCEGYLNVKRKIIKREAILIFEKLVQEYQNQYYNTNITKRAQNLGLTDAMNVRQLSARLSKEELAFMCMKLYEKKSGCSIDNMMATKNINLLDNKQISRQFRNSANLSVDLGFLKADKGVFNPKSQITIEDFIKTAIKVLNNVSVF